MLRNLGRRYFGQFRYQQPFLTSSTWDDELQANANYVPGMQVDAAAGIIYNNWYNVGPFDKIAPVLQLVSPFLSKLVLAYTF